MLAAAATMRSIAAVVVLVIATGCQTSLRTRTPRSGVAFEEEGSCASALVHPDERCVERSVPDNQRTTLAIAAAVGVLVAGFLTVQYVDNNCPIC